MARNVFPNAMLRHVYAAQSQKSGRNSKDTARFRGPVFYSYATPVALILTDATGESVALLSSVSYSSTTSQHIPAERDFAIPAFRVPFLPNQYGGRYSPPARGDSSAAACHAGNLAHLVAVATAGARSVARRAGRNGLAGHSESMTLEDFAGEFYELAATKARDYARRFGLTAPSESDLPADGGFAWYQAALAEWQAKEADPARQRKRAAEQRRREVRAAWMEEHAAPMLRAAGLNPGRKWDRRDVKEALAGIPATEAGADMLRARLAERRERFEREESERAAAERVRQAERDRARAEEAAAAEAAGYTLEAWRLKWYDLHAAERENLERDRVARIPADRALWQSGGYPESLYRGHEWQRDETGSDILRIKPGHPDTLESARGAEVPLSHARRVWRHVLRIMCDAGAWTGSIRCGHFTVTEVSGEWMQAGCHRFHRAEMVRIAALIGEPVTCEEIARLPATETEESAA